MSEKNMLTLCRFESGFCYYDQVCEPAVTCKVQISGRSSFAIHFKIKGGTFVKAGINQWNVQQKVTYKNSWKSMFFTKDWLLVLEKPSKDTYSCTVYASTHMLTNQIIGTT